MIDINAAKEAAKLTAKGDLAHEFMAYAMYKYRLNFSTQTGY
jgi:hypothetical protein